MKPLPSLAIVTQSEKMRLILSRVEAIAASDSTVLLIGETGVGKELFADYIHRASPRSDRPFVKIALSAMPHDLLESELFGHERGSFTSAVSEKKGCLNLPIREACSLMTSTMSLCLRNPNCSAFWNRKRSLRVGGSATIPIDVRLIAASKVSLKEMVEHGSFRADLYYRINVFRFKFLRCVSGAKICRYWCNIS